MKSYEECALSLRDRIFELIPSHPEILEMDSPWALFKISEFKCADLQPSLGQATGALGSAIAKYLDLHPTEHK